MRSSKLRLQNSGCWFPHDVNTMVAVFRARLSLQRRTPGLLLIPQRLPVGQAVAELELVCSASTLDDWLGRIEFLPL